MMFIRVIEATIHNLIKKHRHLYLKSKSLRSQTLEAGFLLRKSSASQRPQSLARKAGERWSSTERAPETGLRQPHGLSGTVLWGCSRCQWEREFVCCKPHLLEWGFIVNHTSNHTYQSEIFGLCLIHFLWKVLFYAHISHYFVYDFIYCFIKFIKLLDLLKQSNFFLVLNNLSLLIKFLSEMVLFTE